MRSSRFRLPGGSFPPSAQRLHYRSWFTGAARCAALSILAAASAACGDAPTAPINNAQYSQTDLFIGTGTEATVGRTVTVDYTGWFYDEAAANHKGVQFDSSIGGTPFSFILGSGFVISGWDRGVAGMRVGGVRRLVIPPSLAYGPTRSGPIPPNATLVFEIEVLKVE